MEKNEISRIAISMSNSKELFILLTAAMIYLDTIYIFPDYVDVGEVISICKHRGLGMLYTAKQKTYKIDSYEMDVNDNNVKVVLFSSGTVKKPKGVMLSSLSLYNNAYAAYKCLQYSDKDKILISKPIYYSYCFTIEFLAGILNGASFYIYEEMFWPSKIDWIIRNKGITVWCTIPTTLKLFIKVIHEYSGVLRILGIGGEKTTTKLMESAKRYFINTRVVQMYGLAEAGPLVTCLDASYSFGKLNSIGAPVEGVSIEIRDSNNNIVDKPFQIGELVISSNSIMEGYLFLGSESKGEMRERKLFTGDLGYYDDEGYYYLCGRTDDVVKVNGRKVYCKEIELALLEIRGIENAIVICVNGKDSLMRLVAFVQVEKEIENKEIVHYCVKNKIYVPDEIRQIKQLPQSKNGKISLRKLRELVEKK